MGRPSQLKKPQPKAPKQKKAKPVAPSPQPKPVVSVDPISYKTAEPLKIDSTETLSRALVTKRRLLEAAICEASFYEYVKRAWLVLETVPFRDGKHIRAICGLLQQISEGKLSDTVLNMPPRHMKSLLVSVFWPTWEWIKNPQEKFLCVSYDKALAEELGVKARKVILSEWYQTNWGHLYSLSSDQNAKHSYTNDKNGARISIQMGGNITGKGGSRLILDDPNDPTAGPAETAETLTFFKDKLQSRLNDPKNPCLVVQQRTAEDDITGFILANQSPEHPITHICLPAEFEADSPSPFDWRKTEGEPLWPELYPTEALRKLQRFMSDSTIAGQYQQRPQSKQGGSFDVSKLTIVDAEPEHCIYLRAWDFAGTDPTEAKSGEPDWTVGTLIAIAPDLKIYIVDVVRDQIRADDVEGLVKLTAEMDSTGIPIGIPQDPAQAGKFQALYYANQLIGYDVRIMSQSGAKTVRAGPLASQMRLGNVALVRGEWNGPWVREVHLFPKGKWDDQVDSAAQAFNETMARGGGQKTPSITIKITQLPRRLMSTGRIIDAPDKRPNPLQLPRRRS